MIIQYISPDCLDCWTLLLFFKKTIMDDLQAKSITPSCWKCSGSGQLKVKIYNETQVSGLHKGAPHFLIILTILWNWFTYHRMLSKLMERRIFFFWIVWYAREVATIIMIAALWPKIINRTNFLLHSATFFPMVLGELIYIIMVKIMMQRCNPQYAMEKCSADSVGSGSYTSGLQGIDILQTMYALHLLPSKNLIH